MTKTVTLTAETVALLERYAKVVGQPCDDMFVDAMLCGLLGHLLPRLERAALAIREPEGHG